LQLFNATAAEDLIVKEDAARGRYVAGAVTNWTLVSLNHDTQVGGGAGCRVAVGGFFLSRFRANAALFAWHA
jgi:ribulose 1,5-bisphosphate synthetase/thiazole synthase